MKIPVKIPSVIEANAIHVFLKVRDEFTAGLVTYDEKTKTKTVEHASIEDTYVPHWMPGEDGAYVDLVIELDTGRVLNWPTRGVDPIEVGKTFFPDKDDE